MLDDLFLARRISEASAELLQTVVHHRYKQRRSIIVTSNRVVQDWGKYLGDATMATTILDLRGEHAGNGVFLPDDLLDQAASAGIFRSRWRKKPMTRWRDISKPGSSLVTH